MKKINRVLMIDDDDEFIAEISDILEDSGYSVAEVNNGYDGKVLIDSNYYDIILLDLKMPGITGYDLLKYINKRCLNSKVLILSGSPMYDNMTYDTENMTFYEKEKIMKLSDGAINKPFKVEILLDKIAELIGS